MRAPILFTMMIAISSIVACKCCDDQSRITIVNNNLNTFTCGSGIQPSPSARIVNVTYGPGTYVFDAMSRQFSFILCGGGGAGGNGFTGNDAGGGGAGACILNLAVMGLRDTEIRLTVGSGGQPACQDCNGGDGGLSSIVLDGTEFIAYGGAGGAGGAYADAGGGGGGDGGPGMLPQGGAAGTPFVARGGDGGSSSTSVQNGMFGEGALFGRFFLSGAGGGANGQNGGDAGTNKGGQASFCNVGNEGGGGASALAKGGNGGATGDLFPGCLRIEDGRMGSGGGGGLDASSKGGDGVAILQYIII